VKAKKKRKKKKRKKKVKKEKVVTKMKDHLTKMLQNTLPKRNFTMKPN